jgi:hypothetical protein
MRGTIPQCHISDSLSDFVTKLRLEESSSTWITGLLLCPELLRNWQHAVLGAYKRCTRSAPSALQVWERLGQVRQYTNNCINGVTCGRGRIKFAGELTSPKELSPSIISKPVLYMIRRFDITFGYRPKSVCRDRQVSVLLRFCMFAFTFSY